LENKTQINFDEEIIDNSKLNMNFEPSFVKNEKLNAHSNSALTKSTIGINQIFNN
jgi:hypothetical protein